MCEHRFDRRPKVGSQPVRPRHCYPTPWPSVRGHGHAAPAPFLNGQKSVSSTPCQYVWRHRCNRRPKVGSQPCRPRQCSPTPLPSVPGHGHAAPAPFLNGQKSVSSTPCQYVCEHRLDRRPKVGNQPAAYSLRSLTLSQTVRGHGHAAPSSSARYGSLPILTSSMLTVDYQRRSSTPTHESMRKRQRTVGNRLVACATVPRDFLEQCGLAETRTWWRACGPILHNKAQCVHHLQLITSCFLELLQDPIEIGRSRQ